MAISEKLVKINEEVVTQEDLLAQIVTALEGKAGGVVEKETILEALRVTENGTYTPSEGVDGFSSVEVAVALAAAGNGFEWHQLNLVSTYAADPAETYSFSIELEDDTFAIILRQTYSPTTRCVLIYGSNYTFNTLKNTTNIETISPIPQLSVSNMIIEDGILYGTYSGVDFVEYALIPLNSGSGSSSTSTYETWVFTLEDGSTVEKEIEVGA